MITVEEAEKIIQSRVKDFGIEEISFENCLGRVLAKDIIADRDLPPFNRVTTDGIAINFSSFEKGNRKFKIAGTQEAGDESPEIDKPGECIEIMTGAALPQSTDTVIRYEDVVIEKGFATITSAQIVKGQSVHFKGTDKKKNEVVAHANKLIKPATVGMADTEGLNI